MGRTGHRASSQHSLKLVSRFKSLQFKAVPENCESAAR